ncbi:MAG: imidazole glycerol phosphate synthase subunit HisF [Planctomycetaceae bacterium]|jgi:imidazole glycerol phosphate synthase glutamine amidotransferase subunit|nr:imidazole glycerol phosphate synthase subunit HisF [Planctomycetaceae bacterium]
MLTLIDYGAGNLTSVKLALESLGCEAVITSDPEVVRQATRVIFPGVGAAAAAMQNLNERGLVPVLHEVLQRGVPFLGICLGTQILLHFSEENGGTSMLSLLPGMVKLFQPVGSQFKVPHMGWNSMKQCRKHPILNGVPDESDFYFVHSYYPVPESPYDIIGTTDYAGTRFASMIGRKNLAAAQFHLEKSGPVGLRILKNFTRWDGTVPEEPSFAPVTGRMDAAVCPVKRRIVPCLDVINRRVTKGVKFKDNIDLGDPVELARRYYNEGADELVVYDITASAEHRKIDIGMVRDAAKAIHIPFAVGGGIATLHDMAEVLEAGAEKVSINSLAVADPGIIAQGSQAFGRQCIVLGMDPVSNPDREKFPSGFEVTVRGFRERTGMDALDWAKRCEDLGVGEIVVNSVDRDGTRIGFELDITGQIARTVSIPVVASGGAGNIDHLMEVFEKTEVSAAIIAGILHTGLYTMEQIKTPLADHGIPIRK